VASFDNLALDGNIIAFIGGPSAGPSGIFVAAGNTLTEIVSAGDTLDGKTVSSLSFSGDRPLSGDQLVFTANFTDGSMGLFLASVPEPGFATIALLAVGIASRRRRRRQ
jgi:hypothetical protein